MKLILITLLFLAGCGTTKNSKQDCSSQEICILKNQLYEIHFPRAQANDSILIDESMKEGLKTLRSYFSNQFDKLANKVPYRIFILDKRNKNVKEGRALLKSGTRDGTLKTYVADLEIFAHSKYLGAGKTIIGLPYDQPYYKKVVIHEYSTSILDVLTRSKEGWKFRQAPNWFVQGFPEYFGLIASTQERIVKLTKLFHLKSREHFDKIDKLPYLKGPSMILYLHELYNKKLILDFLNSHDENFESAFKNTFGISDSAFEKLWKEFIQRYN